MSEIKKRSSRYPTCGRTPSRRLHPELFLSPHPSQLVEAGTSREHTVELSTPRPPSSSGAVCSKEVSLTIQQDTDEDSSDSLSADSDNDSSIIRTPLRPPLHILPLTTMAASVQKFIAPPVFSASPEEDAVDWIERFELAAAYNRWSDADQARNFVMYLEGPARKWFLVNTHPNHWEDLPARPDPTDPTLPHLPAESGIKTQFSAAFQQANFSLLQEAKLRQRTQGNEEDVVSYFYDIVNMCRLVNPNMSQEQQLEYLYRGLKPSLLQKIYPQKPASTADFLDLAKLHMEATMLANQKVWSQSILAVSKEPTLSNAGNNPQPAAMTPEIVSILQQLNHTIKQLQLSSGPTNHSAPSRPRQGHWNGSGKNGRTTEGRYICGFCSKVGHLDYRCFQNPASSLFKGATQPQNQQRSPPQQYPGGRPEFGRQRTQEQHWPVNHMSTEAGIGEMQDRQWPVNHISTEAAMGETTTTDSPWVQVNNVNLPDRTENQIAKTKSGLRNDGETVSTSNGTDKVFPILLSEVSRLIREPVLCGNIPTMAVVDTGAAVSVLSPDLLKQTPFCLEQWSGPTIILANGTRASPLGAALITITHKGRWAAGTAVIMAMEGIDLLLGNDFLKQFGKLQIDYTGDATLVTLGELPFKEIHPQDNSRLHKCSVVAATSHMIPALSVIPVATRPCTSFPVTALFTPSAGLLAKKTLTVGHAILPEKWQTIPVANLSLTPVWLEEGSTLGTIQPYTNEIVQCDWNKTPLEDTVTEKIKGSPDNKEFFLTLGKQINHDLKEEDRETLLALLGEHSQCFALNEKDIGYCTTAEHRINLKEGATPVFQRPYASAWKARKIIQNLADDMLESGIIEVSDSPWGAPVVLIKKKDGSWRFCVDYRGLNDITIKDVYPLPRINDILGKLEGAEYFSIMDLQSGYHQLPLRKEDREKTAFITADGLYHFKVLPFGLTNGPSSFQRAMDVILGGLRWTSCLVYLDDVVVYAPTFKTHLHRLQLVLSCLAKAGLKLKATKCQFAMTTLKVLGHVVSKKGIAPDPEKIAAIKVFAECNKGRSTTENIKQLQSFVGLCSYYRRHIKNFAKIAQPLTMLTRKGAPFIWEAAQQKSFNTLKEALTTSPILAHPDYQAPMIIMTDACGYGIGAVLSQSKEGKEFPLAYASRLLSKSEMNYSITEKECLALIWGLQKFRGFVWGCKIIIITDHEALCWLRTKKELAGRLARWSLCLLEYDVEIRYRNGKLHTNADCLSRYPIPLTETEVDDRCISIGVLQYHQSDFLAPDAVRDIASKQREVTKWREIIEKLESGNSAGRHFCLQEGRLFKLKTVGIQSYMRLCIPDEYKTLILRSCHDEATSGHLGIQRTLQKIAKRFFWHDMAQDVTNYVRACRQCQTRKTPKLAPAGTLQCIKVTRPFQKIGIDLLGPFTLSNTGNKMLIVAVDYLTKWVELKALPSGKADVVASFIVEQIALRHGVPESIISDRGKCFLADITQSVFDKLGTKHKTTASYHPQANGQVERMNHTLATMMSMYISSDQKNWDEMLQHICFAYNTSRQESTGFSPFFLLYGRDPILPIDLILGSLSDSQGETETSYANKMMENLTAARSIVRTRLSQVQEKQKRDYDANHRDVTFQKGDKVLVYKPIRKKGKSDKLLHRWVGPFIVVRQTTPVNYEVKLVNEKTKSDIVHVVSMKPFKEIENWRNDTNSQTEAEKNNRPHQEITGHQSAETQAQPQVQKEGVEVKECSNSQKNQPSNTTQQKNQQDVVKLYDNNQKRTTELPPRIRRRPNFFTAGMIYFLSLIILGIMDSSTAIMIRDTVLFKDQPGISISESSWTIVADVLLQDAEEAIVIVEKHLEEMSSLAAKHRKDGANFEKMDAHTAWRDTTSFMAADKIDKKVLLLSRAVNNSKSRLTTCALTLSGAGRPKRGVLDAGGSMLKWLFGVTTQADLLDLHNKIETMGKQNREIVHVLDKHASIVNETLQLTRENLVLLQELQQQSAILNKRVDYILDYIQSYELVHIQQEQYFAELDATFDTIEHVIRWLQQQIEDWEIGLSTLASGHISPQMFPPTELQRVIKEINNNLPLGWTIPSEELWVIYREARVSVAAIHNKFRLFIEIPIYDHAQQFNLFQIIKLSKPTANGTHGVRFTNLPEYLAVSPDLDTFIELSDLEMLNCRQLDKQLCKFHTGFAKRGKKKSCAIALFTNDETQANACCQTQFTQWNGPEIAYLGQNRWAFSTSGPHDVVFSCPPDSKHLPPQRLQLPAIGYFEVPPGCTARTEDWIFPASLEGSSTAAAVSIKMPDFAEFRQNITSQKTATVVQFPSLNTSHFNQVSKHLLQQEKLQSTAAMTHNQIMKLLDSPLSTNCNNATYPFEWIVAFIFTSLAIGGLAGFTLRLAQRLNIHLKNNMGIYETTDYHPRRRNSDPAGENFIHSQDVEL